MRVNKQQYGLPGFVEFVLAQNFKLYKGKCKRNIVEHKDSYQQVQKLLTVRLEQPKGRSPENYDDTGLVYEDTGRLSLRLTEPELCMKKVTLYIKETQHVG